MEVFLLVSQSGNFSDAARSLRLTPSALSRSVAQLEVSLGVRLFDRSTRSVVLTAEGNEFVLTARRVLDEFDHELDNFGQYVSGRRGRVSVAALPSVAVTLLAPLIAKFERQQPGAEIHFQDSIAGGVFKAVQEGRADFGLTCSLQPDGDIDVEPLVADKFFVLCRKDHPLAKKKTVLWKELENYPYVASAPTSSVRFYTDAAFMQAGVKVRYLYEPVGFHTAANLVLQNLGVTTLPGLVLPSVALPGLTHRPLTHPTMVRQVCLLTKVSRPQSPLGRAFASFLRHEVRGGLLDGKFGRFAWSCRDKKSGDKK